MPARWTSRKFLVTVLAIGLVVVSRVSGMEVGDVASAAVAASGGLYVLAEAAVDVARAKGDSAAARG